MSALRIVTYRGTEIQKKQERSATVIRGNHVRSKLLTYWWVGDDLTGLDFPTLRAAKSHVDKIVGA